MKDSFLSFENQLKRKKFTFAEKNRKEMYYLIFQLIIQSHLMQNAVFGEVHAAESAFFWKSTQSWLSVDPLADKYPHQSNYVYCSNYPIRLVDTDGMDEWEFDKKGYLTKRENGRTDVDIVHAVDTKGNNVSSEYANNTISDFKTGSGEEGSIDYMQISNTSDGTRFYEFASDNTDVEWANKSTSEGSFVGTSHDPSSVASGYMNIPSTATIYEDSHSHTPRG